MMELWMVTFGDEPDVTEYNGVYSTRERAIEAIDRHFAEMVNDGNHQYSWENRVIISDEHECRYERFDLVEHGYSEPRYITIERKILDDEF